MHHYLIIAALNCQLTYIEAFRLFVSSCSFSGYIMNCDPPAKQGLTGETLCCRLLLHSPRIASHQYRRFWMWLLPGQGILLGIVY